jgi:hydrogenase maturation protease
MIHVFHVRHTSSSSRLTGIKRGGKTSPRPSPKSASPVLVIGVGNRFRSDDAAGLIVAGSITAKTPSTVRVIEQSGEGASLIDSWKGSDSVVIIDATSSGSEPGTIHRFDVSTTPLPTKFFNYSTHAFSVAEAVELSRAMGMLPRKLIVYGIEGKNFSAGTSITPVVLRSIRRVLKMILSETGPAKETGLERSR